MEADTAEHDAGTGFLGGLGFGGCGDAATDGCEGRVGQFLLDAGEFGGGGGQGGLPWKTRARKSEDMKT